MYYLDIKKIRLSKCITQRQLANRIKISQSYLSKLELNYPDALNGVSLRILSNIASALNVPLNDIIKNKNDILKI